MTRHYCAYHQRFEISSSNTLLAERRSFSPTSTLITAPIPMAPSTLLAFRTSKTIASAFYECADRSMLRLLYFPSLRIRSVFPVRLRQAPPFIIFRIGSSTGCQWSDRHLLRFASFPLPTTGIQDIQHRLTHIVVIFSMRYSVNYSHGFRISKHCVWCFHTTDIVMGHNCTSTRSSNALELAILT